MNLSEETLLVISGMGSEAYGFSSAAHAQNLNERFGISFGKARRDLAVAEYLYERVSDTKIGVTEAVSEIASLAAALENPVHIDEKRRAALEAVLSFSEEREMANAKGRSLRNVPHFADAGMSWSIRPIRTRDGHIVKVPVITMNISWHDSSGHDHEAFFYLSEMDLDRINETLRYLADSREDIEAIL